MHLPPPNCGLTNKMYIRPQYPPLVHTQPYNTSSYKFSLCALTLKARSKRQKWYLN